MGSEVGMKPFERKWREERVADLRKREMEHVATVESLRELEVAGSGKARYRIESEGWRKALAKAYATVYGEIIGCHVDLDRYTSELAADKEEDGS